MKDWMEEVGKKNTEELRPEVRLTCSNTVQLNFFKWTTQRTLNLWQIPKKEVESSIEIRTADGKIWLQ